MTKRNVYLNTSFAALFTLMMVTITFHGNYGAKFLTFSVSFGAIVTFITYKISRSYLKETKHKKKISNQEPLSNAWAI